MSESTDSIWSAVVAWAAKNLGVLAAWLTSITIAEAQAVLGFATGLLVFVFTSFSTYVLWRDKIKRQPPKE